MNMEHGSPQPLVPLRLEPVATALPRTHSHSTGGYPPPRLLPKVVALASRLSPILAGIATAARYRGADLLAALDADPTARLTGLPVDRDLFEMALMYAGHGQLLSGDEVVLLPAADVATFDEAVLARLAALGARGVDRVSVREALRVCRWRRAGEHLDRNLAWRMRGALHRLEAAGSIARHPECRWWPATLWQVPTTTIASE